MKKNITGKYTLRIFDIWYIPYDKVLEKDPASYKEWMAVYASNFSEARKYGKEEGLILEIKDQNNLVSQFN